MPTEQRAEHGRAEQGVAGMNTLLCILPAHIVCFLLDRTTTPIERKYNFRTAAMDLFGVRSISTLALIVNE